MKQAIRAIRANPALLQEYSVPRKVEGVWRPPVLSLRQSSVLRKELNLPSRHDIAVEIPEDMSPWLSPKLPKNMREETKLARAAYREKKTKQIQRALKDQQKLRMKAHDKPPRGLELLYVQPKKNEFRVFRTQAKNVRANYFSS